jgi:hypothetical protein
MAGLRDEDPELWKDLERTYAALEEFKKRGGYPPPSHDLLTLADRLDEAADGATRSQPPGDRSLSFPLVVCVEQDPLPFIGGAR